MAFLSLSVSVIRDRGGKEGGWGDGGLQAAVPILLLALESPALYDPSGLKQILVHAADKGSSAARVDAVYSAEVSAFFPWPIHGPEDMDTCLAAMAKGDPTLLPAPRAGARRLLLARASSN